MMANTIPGWRDSLPPILVAEDDPFSRDLLEEAAKEAHLPIPLHVVRDGAEVVDYMKRCVDPTCRTSSPAPGSILMELSLPRVNGMEVLGFLRGRPEFHDIPVLILGVSNDSAEACYRAGATAFLVKPVRFTGLVSAIRLAEAHWCRYVHQRNAVTTTALRGQERS